MTLSVNHSVPESMIRGPSLYFQKAELIQILKPFYLIITIMRIKLGESILTWGKIKIKNITKKKRKPLLAINHGLNEKKKSLKNEF